MSGDRRLLILELNEINLAFVESYVARGALPTFGALIRDHGVSRTTSEQRYEDLEPWIQWVTAHTGLTLQQHGVFRLGDIVEKDLSQIWERLEEHGLKVGAVSPMNAKHRLRAPAFFVPDPWTKTQVTARPVLRGLYEAIAQAVNDNASSRIRMRSAVGLLRGLAYYGYRNAGIYADLLMSARSRPWRKAMLLDQLLADAFIQEVRTTQPHFASLFLNAGAHIQHHYMFCSTAYRGGRSNPDWYVNRSVDPVLDVYDLYDRIVGAVQEAFPEARLMLVTGLHQVPHETVTFYWRLRHHERFLRSIGAPFRGVEPRMSRDFIVDCGSPENARQTQKLLEGARAPDGLPVFEVDNRGRDLFVMLTYPKEITDDFKIRIAEREVPGFKKEVAFVALKNGEHHGVGYFIDTGASRSTAEPEFSLTEMPQRIFRALGLQTA